MKNIFLVIGIALLFAQCREGRPAIEEATTPQLSAEDIEAREDSMELAQAYADQAKIEWAVTPAMEMEAISATSTEDAADDPAFWIHPTDVEKSLIYGSNKRGGLAVYDLSGKEIDYYPLGSINNVDIIYNYPINGQKRTLLGCSNRTTQAIDIFYIDETDGKLTSVSRDTFFMDSTRVNDIYGFCFGKYEGDYYALINGKNGLMQQYQMSTAGNEIALELVREVQFADQTEGMAVDEQYGRLFVGEEDAGVWMLSIDPTSTAKTLIVSSSADNNPNIIYDVEGVTLYQDGDKGYLLASSQGNFSYAVFDRLTLEYLGSFKIMDADGVDGVQETDGIDAISTPVGDRYPRGLFIAQDGFNYDGDTLRAQNFKVVDWREVERVIQQK